MSGLEVAGVVLGAIPLVIAGLRPYAKGVSTVKHMFQAQSDARSLIRRLEVEHRILENAIEHLLYDCVDDELLRRMLNNFRGDVWNQPEVDLALQNKLYTSYKVYKDAVKDMKETLVTFSERLELDDSGKVWHVSLVPMNVRLPQAPQPQGPGNDPNSLKLAWKRFQFGIRKADYSDLVDRIQRDNSALRRLTEQSVVLEPARTTKQKISTFRKVRDPASSIFITLQTGLRGPCQASHRASLYMRPLEAEAKCPLGDEEPVFRFIFHHGLSAPSQSQPHWVIEEAEIRTLREDPSYTNIPTTTTPPNCPPVAPKGKNSVRWQASPQHLPTTTTSTTRLQPLERIEDLCGSLEKLQASQCGICLGYLHDRTTAGRHGLYWPEKRLVDRTDVTPVSLGTLLVDSVQQGKSPLSVADSRRLAFALSVGVSQLHDTPWLAEQWSRDDITLFKQDNLTLAMRPFVSADLQKPLQPSAPEGTPVIRNQTLFALGIVLLELCMGQKFDSLLLPGDLNADGTKHAASDFSAGCRLIEQVYDQAGKRYGDAVRRCILCDFNQWKTDLKDDAFYRAFYVNVVAVLEEDVAQFFGL